jgi:pimeloyl-ACP methyl ester carboxylesterase
MAPLPERGLIDLGDQQLEYRFAGPRPDAAPTLVLLHEGLGSAALWGDFPDKLAAATKTGAFIYSRAGCGGSSTISLPRPLAYMHDEALKILPRLLDAIGFRRGILVGHSDGASIAAIYAGGVQDHRVCGLSLIAPHFFVEDVGLAEIARAKQDYDHGELRRRLARWHTHVDAAFRGWNDAWLDPDFRKWDITEYLSYIRIPLQIVQGADDQYGTLRQLSVAQQECTCPVDVEVLPGARHAPYREAPDLTVRTITDFVNRVLETHGERQVAE